MENNIKKQFIAILVVSVLLSTSFGAAAGFLAGSSGIKKFDFDKIIDSVLKGEVVSVSETEETRVILSEESAVISVVEKVSPAVVSIIVTKDLPKMEQFGSPFGSDFFRRFFGDSFDELDLQQVPGGSETETVEVGGGTGFLVSDDGFILTNKHVVTDEAAEYTVLLNDERRFPAKVLARDPINDLAILKIDSDQKFQAVELGDSSNLKTGQTVVAIGNALGEFRNTVSTGVISGLARSIVAGGTSIGTEELSGVIQTDASINPGNSGGPLLDSAGRVIGINTAIAQGAQNIGFAIPINEAKNVIDSVRQFGRIVRPWLGVRYVQVTKALAVDNSLEVDYGALVLRGEQRTELAVIPGSPADKAGLAENDIILEVNGKKIDTGNPLAKTIAGFKVGDEISLKIIRKGEAREIKVKLEEMK